MDFLFIYPSPTPFTPLAEEEKVTGEYSTGEFSSHWFIGAALVTQRQAYYSKDPGFL